MNTSIRRNSGSARTPLLCLIAAVGGAGAMLFYAQKEKGALQSQLAELREQVRQMETKATDPKEVERLRAQAREAVELKKEVEEVHRLRGEVTLLRKDKATFEKASAENAQLRDWASRVQAENAVVRGQNQSLAQAQAAAISGASPQVEQTHKALCIANLKQLDGAIQQWALENNRKATDDVELRPVLSFLKGSLLPVCPSRGLYQPGPTVSAAPTCSIPGHTL